MLLLGSRIVIKSFAKIDYLTRFYSSLTLDDDFSPIILYFSVELQSYQPVKSLIIYLPTYLPTYVTGLK